jgi:peroxiredoxin
MALTYSSPSTPGAIAPDFSLPGVDGKTYSLKEFRDARALVVIFMCNHCPYVIAVQDRINALAKKYSGQSVKLVGINSNDVANYPDDSFENMKKRAVEKGFAFPYLFDESQSVAKAFNAACTPDPYLYENVGGKFLLRYQGRIDDSWKDEKAVTHRDLAEAIDAVLAGRPVASDQKPSMGCNIKWKKSP